MEKDKRVLGGWAEFARLQVLVGSGNLQKGHKVAAKAKNRHPFSILTSEPLSFSSAVISSSLVPRVGGLRGKVPMHMHRTRRDT